MGWGQVCDGEVDICVDNKVEMGVEMVQLRWQ